MNRRSHRGRRCRVPMVRISDGAAKIGILNDMPGVFSDRQGWVSRES